MRILQFAGFKQSLEHPARTAVAAVLALEAARWLGLPEVYWAPITTIIIMQSTLGAALTIAWERLAGTAMGSVVGAVLVTYCGSGILAFGAAVFGTGLLCTALGLDRTAYRFAGITLTVIMLMAHASESVWVAAAHRFVEVSVGIAVGVVVTAIWPDAPASPAEPPLQKPGS